MLCIIPFKSTMIENGRYAVCCVSDKSSLTTKDLSIKDFFYSSYMDSIRQKMLANEWPDECSRCKKKESLGLESMRTDALKRSPEFDGSVPKLRYLDLRLSNKCNLGCRMCWSGQSSVIAEEEGIRIEIGHKQEIFDDIETLDLRDLYITGGEPMLVKENYQLLQILKDSGKDKKINLRLNTNCTVITDRFLELIKGFKSVCVNLSIDGIGPVQEYIRWQSDWAVIENNFHIWRKHAEQNSNVEIVLTPVIQILNAPYLDEYIGYFKDYIDLDSNLDPIALDSPDFMDLTHASDSIWKQIDLQAIDNKKIREIIEAKRMHREMDKTGMLKDYLTKQDRKRKIHIEEYLPYFGFLV
jgi:sulfatase maturation enzyme AslB (radical SAM superfamily)